MICSGDAVIGRGPELLGLVAGIGERAVWHGLETMLWAAGVTCLLAASCMAFPGGGRALLCVLAFFGGVILASVILSSVHNDRLLRPHWMTGAQMLWNLLVVLCLLTACFAWQCLRQIRDRHRRQQPLMYAAAGILAVLLIALVPLPGGLPHAPVTSSVDTLPKVTKARLNQDNMSFGHRDGVAFASMNIELIPDHPINADAIEFNDAALRVTDPAGVPQHVETSHLRITSRFDMDAMPRAYPTLVYYVFEQQPGPRSGMSYGSDPEKAGLVASLPHRTVRITGTMGLKRIDHRVIHRGPLDRPFELGESGIRVAFTDSSNRLSRYDHSVLWKAYMPPLATSLSWHHRDLVRFRLEHAVSHGIDWYDQLEGGGSGGGAFFGRYRVNELRISDRKIESDYYWEKLKELGYDKSVREWKQEAELVCEVVDEVHPLILPVDIEVEVPDPNKIRELLLKGAL